MSRNIAPLNIFHGKIHPRQRRFCMKKKNNKVNVQTINFTKLLYNNYTINVNTNNSSNSKLKSLRNNLLYVIECYLLIFSIIATTIIVSIILFNLIFSKSTSYALYVLLSMCISIIGFLIKNCNH